MTKDIHKELIKLFEFEDVQPDFYFYRSLLPNKNLFVFVFEEKDRECQFLIGFNSGPNILH